MKAILEFNLEDEYDAELFKLHSKLRDSFCILEEVQSGIRSLIKYGSGIIGDKNFQLPVEEESDISFDIIYDILVEIRGEIYRSISNE